MSSGRPRNPLAVVGLSVAFFAVVAVAMAAVAISSDDPTGWGFAAVSAGFAIMGGAVFAFGPADARGKRAPGAAGWALLLVGAAVMSAGPLVLHAAGTGWGDVLGGGRRSASLWMLAILIWGGALAIVVAAVRSAARAVRRSRGRDREDRRGE
ncbi:hypothetical protein [Leucobacter chromiiresistens]|uniref:Uncharacterized protein n=1 Tax=Leucobacter chromiiresistens TaxID=1079994 RepID=A0A1H0Z033_9MICO|nr:hypothetical protein [Leucobacter chromiiresistens]SDQ20783.1 hypothetical protein SAMN04488565_1336 [Leucobacter chromiiresistens]